LWKTCSIGNTRYRSNAGSVYSLKYPIVFCPKYRRKFLVGEIADELRSLLYQKAQALDVTIEALEIMLDHDHLLPYRSATTPRQPIQGVSVSNVAPEFPTCLVHDQETLTESLLPRS
jgi:hypothetical protein